jgi:ATP-dependent Zn protease
MPDTSLRHSRRVQRQSGKREWDTAYHEAGHAVAAFFLGMSIGRNGVTIVPDKIKQTLGTGHILSQLRERPDVSVSPRTYVQIENRAVMDMAGDVAEKKFRPRRHYGGQTDLLHASDLLSCISESNEITTARLNVAVLRARSLVELRRREITAVANALVERKTLTAEQVCEAILSCQQHPKK